MPKVVFNLEIRKKLELLLNKNINKIIISNKLNIPISSLYREISKGLDTKTYKYKAQIANKKSIYYKK